MADSELAALAATQGGLVTYQQARDHLSHKQLKTRIADGRLLVVRRGVLRYPAVPVTRWHPLRAALLSAGPEAAASHCSAAEVWRLPGLIASGPELTVPWPARLRLEARLTGFHPGDSPAELDVRRILVEAGLGEPVPQHQVDAGGTVYLLDWSYPDELIAIDYNGWEFHGARSAFDHDAARTSALTAAGWRLLIVTSATAPPTLIGNVRALRAAAAA